MLPIIFLGDAKDDLFNYLSEAVGFLTLLVGVALLLEETAERRKKQKLVWQVM